MDQSDFRNILEKINQGVPAQLEFEAEGESYVRMFHPRERLIVLGGGHVAQPVCHFAAELSFAVTVVDDRPSFANHLRFPEAEKVICDSFEHALEKLKINENDYVAIITRGHRWDADCLRAILPHTMPKYLGMIGSRRRTAGLFNLLEEEGFPRARLNQIYTPIGLDIGALTIQEIAISIVAELIEVRRKGGKRTGIHGLLVSQEIDDALFKFIVKDNRPKVLMIICDTSGSTPAKSGAMMAVNDDFQTAGTIGGGCGENEVLREAFSMVGTGQSRCMEVDMSNDVAEDEGMVCGGRMKVWIQDLS
ncbi:MAG: XdhC family protein [Lachnospiraceae bacterium]